MASSLEEALWRKQMNKVRERGGGEGGPNSLVQLQLQCKVAVDSWGSLAKLVVKDLTGFGGACSFFRGGFPSKPL